ncbi:hypothetical protein BJ138DRAFT_1119141 [Hygrophoropsis aurantiaca]|uniref:Uncharacterized protein n=1 Tax=Hygrophoropsis aurantiaca TaxID=72124 RepID=A0ACB7ZV29_9AGAM|nr:hypothetical protein BJ138DRAFT_1119141 [Hygrophoropsis aurantiaca]
MPQTPITIQLTLPAECLENDHIVTFSVRREAPSSGTSHGVILSPVTVQSPLTTQSVSSVPSLGRSSSHDTTARHIHRHSVLSSTAARSISHTSSREMMARSVSRASSHEALTDMFDRISIVSSQPESNNFRRGIRSHDRTASMSTAPTTVSNNATDVHPCLVYPMPAGVRAPDHPESASRGADKRFYVILQGKATGVFYGSW